MKKPARKKKVLFVCTHNSGRSLMAQELLNQLYGDHYEAQCAELRPGSISPFVKQVLAEHCIDVSDYQPQPLFDVIKTDQIFANVVTICDEGLDRRPIFPGVTERLEWTFPDPLAAQGTSQLKRAAARVIRDRIKARIEKEFAPNLN